VPSSHCVVGDGQAIAVPDGIDDRPRGVAVHRAGAVEKRVLDGDARRLDMDAGQIERAARAALGKAHAVDRDVVGQNDEAALDRRAIG
jgi:hypothetical protein